ncbi:MAG: carboxypeptidase-like regulatory domain-containing protein [Bacteroidetes bacterium]|nr:carboxypeptidase-like regulatory domain-containing protein [Bacteroidota bacterium]
MPHTKSLIVAVILLLASMHTGAQGLSGKVIDAQSGKPVAFAHVTDSLGRLVAVCDLDGNFSLESKHKSLSFSSIGYEKQTVGLSGTAAPVQVLLLPKVEELAEVEVKAGENPAWRIVRNARANLRQNAPQSLQSYRLRRYDRLVIGADSNIRLPDERLENHLRTHDLLVMEILVEEIFTADGGKKSSVIATKVSGLRDPVFVFLMDQLHATDFYGEQIMIGGQLYASPLAAGSLSQYSFLLEESLAVSETDSLFSIRFEPRPGSRFSGLRGRISILSPDWAIKSVVARPAAGSGSMDAEVLQLYEKQDDQAWFPVTLNTRLWLRIPTATGMATLAGEGLSRISGIQINQPAEAGKQRGVRLEVDKDAWGRSEEWLYAYRPDSLDLRLQRTYRYMDSLGAVVGLDRWLGIAEALSSGSLRLGGFDFPFNKLLKFNETEGYRPGLAFRTNERYSSTFSLMMYGAYATRIRKPLWQIEASVHSRKTPNAWLAVSFHDTHRAREAGLSDEQTGVFNPYTFRQYFYSAINNIQGYKAGFSFPLGETTSLQPWFARETIEQLNPAFLNPGNSGLVTTIALGIRLAPGEQWMRTDRGLRRLNPPNPLLMTELQRIHYQYNGSDILIAHQLRIAAEYLWKHPFSGQTAVKLESGLSDRKLPDLLMFELPGSYNKYLLYAPLSFGSITPGSIQSEGFAALYLTHNMLPLRAKNKKFRPQPAIVQHIAMLIKPTNSIGDNQNTNLFSQPIAESGLIINNLIRSPGGNLGTGIFYHWGSYAASRAANRLLIKIALTFNTMGS